MSDWLIEGRLVSTPCRRCGQATLSTLAYAWGVECIRCGVGPVLPKRPPIAERAHWRAGQGGVGFSHVPRNSAELERPAGPVRTELLVTEMLDLADVGAPSTVVRLLARTLNAGGSVRYAAAWFCEGDAGELGFDAFVLREAIAVTWDGGFATWGRSGRGRWTPGHAFWRDPDDGGVRYGRCSAVPATLFT